MAIGASNAPISTPTVAPDPTTPTGQPSVAPTVNPAGLDEAQMGQINPQPPISNVAKVPIAQPTASLEPNAPTSQPSVQPTRMPPNPLINAARADQLLDPNQNQR